MLEKSLLQAMRCLKGSDSMEFSLEHRFPLEFAYQKDRSHFSLVKLPTLPGLAGLWIVLGQSPLLLLPAVASSAMVTPLLLHSWKAPLLTCPSQGNQRLGAVLQACQLTQVPEHFLKTSLLLAASFLQMQC